MFFEKKDDGILLRVRLMPNSSSCRLNGVFCDAKGQEFLKICIISVPEKGKANKELLALIAKKLKVAKSDCMLIMGELERYKTIKISGNADVLAERLTSWIEENK